MEVYAPVQQNTEVMKKKMRGEDGSKRNVARSICHTPLKQTLPSDI